MLIGGVAMALPAMAEETFVYEYEGQAITYLVLDEEAKTCQTLDGSSEFNYSTFEYLNIPGNEVSGELVLPANPKNGDVEYTLVKLGDYAFLDNSELTSVEIPSTVTSVGESAFDGCKALAKACFASMESFLNIEFGGGAANPIYFSHNLYIAGEEVVNPVIPEGITKLNNYAFAGLTDMKTIELPTSLVNIGEGVFNSCSSLEKIIIPEGVETIGMGAFMFCSALKSIELPSTLKSVAGYSFYECTGLEKASFGSIESLCGIDFGDTFANPLRYTHYLYIAGEEVSEVIVPEGITQIKNYAFFEANFITSVKLPETLESIGVYGFNHCYSMTSISLPGSLTSIGQEAFAGCPALTEMILPPSVTSVGNMAFNNCSGIIKSAYPEQLETNPFIVEDPWGFDPDINYGGTTISYNATDAELTDGILFTDAMTTVKYVSIFAGPCITVPAGVIYLADNSFACCEDLNEVVLPEDLMTLGSGVFDNCNKLEKIECKASTMAPMASDDSFSENVCSNATLYVPAGCKDMYASAEGWKDFQKIEEGSISGVAIADVDCVAPCEVFDLNGVRVANSVEDLTVGVYVVRQGSKVRKICVK